MRILLTNDDGIHAEGLEVLERIARTLSDDVWIVAPETDQSGFSHSLSISNPLRIRKIDERRYSVRGTPTDCVIMGVRKLMPEPPDLILSGINSGSNVADDVTYSGTVAGAMEGTLLGIRSIALSQAYTIQNEERVLSWETGETLAPPLLRKLLAAKQSPGTLININFPSCAPGEVQGTVVTSQGKLVHGLWVDQRADGRGLPYYWLRFGREPPEIVAGTDLEAIRQKKISVTPLHLDMTAHAEKDALSAIIA